MGMLVLNIPSIEIYNEQKEEFLEIPKTQIKLEHSLVSLSKWESKWKKPFLSGEKTSEETLDYIRCMVIDDVQDEIITTLQDDLISSISKYIEDPMTATTFQDNEKKKGNETITSEIIYYWMIALNIPFECQYWHLNRLLTLIRVCNIKNTPPKKMGRGEILSRNKVLNEARRKALNTRG